MSGAYLCHNCAVEHDRYACMCYAGYLYTNAMMDRHTAWYFAIVICQKQSYERCLIQKNAICLLWLPDKWWQGLMHGVVHSITCHWPKPSGSPLCIKWAINVWGDVRYSGLECYLRWIYIQLTWVYIYTFTTSTTIHVRQRVTVIYFNLIAIDW